MTKTKNKKTEKEKFRLREGNLLFIALSILLFCSAYSSLKAQAIPQYFFGGNAWMTDSIGNDNSYNGKLHSNWKNVQYNPKIQKYNFSNPKVSVLENSPHSNRVVCG